MLVARVAGVLGGLAWVVRHLADVEVLRLPGLVLLGLGLAAAAAGLVSSSAVWLRLIVAVCFPVLVWSVAEVLHGSAEDSLVDAAAGAAIALACVVGMVRAPRRHVGSHAA
jgi:hypothetical protein